MAQYHANPELKAILAEATHALARLDADRLEEIALYCGALVDGADKTSIDWGVRERKVETAERGVAVLARVLEATRANLQVLRRLRELTDRKLEYGPKSQNDRLVEINHGDD